MYIVYKIVRDDGKIYIGTTYKKGLSKRMKAHSKTDRFASREFSWSVVEESDDYQYILDREEYYISVYDSYHNGLNESINGRGNHLSDDFTTKNYVFSEESRKRMSDAAKRRVELCGVPFKGGRHTDEQRAKWRDIRSGVVSHSKLNMDSVIEIVDLYVQSPHIDGVGDIMKNGRSMSYCRAFSLKYSKVFGVTPEAIEKIIKGRSWKDVQRKYEV